MLEYRQHASYTGISGFQVLESSDMGMQGKAGTYNAMQHPSLHYRRAYAGHQLLNYNEAMAE